MSKGLSVPERTGKELVSLTEEQALRARHRVEAASIQRTELFTNTLSTQGIENDVHGGLFPGDTVASPCLGLVLRGCPQGAPFLGQS